MNARHFFHDAEALVRDALQGVAYTNPQLHYDADNKCLINTQHDAETIVTLISGGGAGHEPSFAGLVGHNLLSAAVSGFCFASPSAQQISNTVLQAGGSAGTLLIIMNYTGDILHFHLAAEKARINGKETAVLVVGDDVSVGRKKGGRVGRRGLAGTVLVHKILGAAAADGLPLKDVVVLGERVVANLGTVGAALDHVHVPGRAYEQSFGGNDQVELGMGIHNEPGCRVISPTPSINNLVQQMLDQLCNLNDPDRSYVHFGKGSDVVLLVNNLGGVSQLEFSAITKIVVEELGVYGCKVARIYAGTFMTSLDSKGFSISLLRVDAEMLGYLDVQVSAPGWTAPTYAPSLWSRDALTTKARANGVCEVDTARSPSKLQVDLPAFEKLLASCCDTILSSEATIDSYDALVGDGDCGSTLGRAARAVKSSLGQWPGKGDAVVAVEHLADLLEGNMDGTSGALYSIFFSALAANIKSIDRSTKESSVMTEDSWTSASQQALQTLYRVTSARPGDRTLIDALAPFVDTLVSGKGLQAAVAAAATGRDGTKGMPAALGRAAYVPESNWAQVPDPGAEGVVCIVQALLGMNSA